MTDLITLIPKSASEHPIPIAKKGRTVEEVIQLNKVGITPAVAPSAPPVANNVVTSCERASAIC